MEHKSNPVSAISARASARRAPFLAAHLFAQMEQEHERAAGEWHAEWSVLVDLLRATGMPRDEAITVMLDAVSEGRGDVDQGERA